MEGVEVTGRCVYHLLQCSEVRGLPSSQSDLNHRQVGSPWMNATDLIPHPAKQNTNSKTQLCQEWAWEGQDGAGETEAQGTSSSQPKTCAPSVLLAGDPDSEQPVSGDKVTSSPDPPSFSRFPDILPQSLPFLLPAGAATPGR